MQWCPKSTIWTSHQPCMWVECQWVPHPEPWPCAPLGQRSAREYPRWRGTTPHRPSWCGRTCRKDRSHEKCSGRIRQCLFVLLKERYGDGGAGNSDHTASRSLRAMTIGLTDCVWAGESRKDIQYSSKRHCPCCRSLKKVLKMCKERWTCALSPHWFKEGYEEVQVHSWGKTHLFAPTNTSQSPSNCN